MADSNITKKALATALKELMEEKAFEKISVGDICERCDMNRKSFYYHFKDKYDLVNWIFDTEFIAVAKQKTYEHTWEMLEDACRYFADNRTFYRKALRIRGQNSFSDYFHELMLVMITAGLEDMAGTKNVSMFQINFFADSLVMAIQRWILEYDEMSVDLFMKELKMCVKYLSIKYGELD